MGLGYFICLGDTAFFKLKIKLAIKTAERRPGVFIVNFEHISHLFLVFLLLTLNK